jgi:tetratricopeptide (TPR) repeat protein
MRGQPRSKSITVTSTIILFFTLVLVLGTAIGFGIAGWLAAQSPVRSREPVTDNTGARLPDKPTLPDLQSKYDGLKDTAKDLDSRFLALETKLKAGAEKAEGMEKLLSLVLVITSLYALALGVNAYVGLQSTLKKAENELDEIQRRYPELADLDQNLRMIVNRTSVVTRRLGEDWTRAYKDLAARQRGEFMLAESLVGGMELFGLGQQDKFSKDIIEIYHGLGIVLSSKFSVESENGSENRNDWERALIYFEKARNGARSGTGLDAKAKARLFKDCGVHLTMLQQVNKGRSLSVSGLSELNGFAQDAKWAFEESLAQNPEQAGALFGLSWICAEMTDFSYAIKTITRLIGLESWEGVDREKYLAFAYYNRASFRVLGAPGDAAVHGEAMADLVRSAKLAKEQGKAEQWRKTFDDDSSKVGGDLRSLWSTHAGELQALRDSI